ncbi:SRPBCC family protein, partial [Mycolicibacterium conceptionense]
MARDVIAVDTTLDHPCPDIWPILEAPHLYPRFFRGLGSCEQVAGDPQLFEVRLSTARGAVVVHQMRRTVRLSGMELRLDATQTGRCFASIRLTPEGRGARIALRIFAIGTLHPDIAKASDNAVESWIREGLQRISDHLEGNPTAQLVNMGDGRSLQLNVLKTMITSGVVRASRPDRGVRQLNSLAKWGFTLAGGLGAAAARSPGTTASIDGYGTSTYGDMADRTSRLAAG